MKKNYLIVNVVFAFFIILSFCGIAYAKTYYVDGGTGSDSNNGLSETTAFKSIGKAVDRYGPLTSGDTVMVKPGTYSGFDVVQKSVTIQKLGVGDVVVDSSIKVTAWTLYSGQIYYATLSTEPTAVVVDRFPLFPEFTLAKVVEGRFYYDSGTKRLYLWAPGGGPPANHQIGIVGDDEYSPGVVLREATSTKISGLTFRYASGHGIEIYSNNAIIENCTIEFNGKAGISLYGYASSTSDNALIQNNTVYHNMLRNWPRGRYKWCCWSMGIVSHGTPNFKAIGNKVYKNGGEGIGSYSGSGGTIIRNNIVFDNWSVNIYVDNQKNALIENNVSYSSTPNFNDLYNNEDPEPTDNKNARRLRPEGIMLGNEDYGSGFNLQNITIINNRIFNCRRGINYYGEGGGLKDVFIANNSILVANQPEVGGGWLSGIAIPGGSNSNVTFKNNIIYSTNATNVVLDTYSNNATVMNNNLYYSVSNTSPFRYNDKFYSFSSWKSVNGAQDSKSIFMDPQFVSTEPSNVSFLKIGVSSPAVDSAETLIQVQIDCFNTMRPVGSAYDMGAHEYYLNAPVIPNLSAPTGLMIVQ